MSSTLSHEDEVYRLALGEKILFLDDKFIASGHGIKRTFYSVQKYSSNPVITEDTLIDGCYKYTYASMRGGVLKDHDKIRMWYLQVPGGLCLAESKDGIHWKKPELDIVRKNGRPTNIVVDETIIPKLFGSQSVIYNPVDPDSSRRYKHMVAMKNVVEGFSTDPIGFLFIAMSPDGIHWKIDERTAIPKEIFDESHFFYDARLKKYVVYGRYWGEGVPRPGFKFDRRKVIRTESEDLIHWTKPELVLQADELDPKDTQIYSMRVFNYGAMYIGLVQMFYVLGPAGYWTLDVQLAWSYDGKVWHRPDDRPRFIPLGSPGEWDRFGLLPAGAPVEMEDELWFYYVGGLCRHTGRDIDDLGILWGAIGLGTLRKDGFCSLEASYSGGNANPVGEKPKQSGITPPSFGGEVVTTSFVLPEGELYVNVKSNFGKVVVEVLDEENKIIPGYVSKPVIANGVRVPVIFDKPISAINSRPVSLCFRLMNARLYAFSIE